MMTEQEFYARLDDPSGFPEGHDYAFRIKPLGDGSCRAHFVAQDGWTFVWPTVEKAKADLWAQYRRVAAA
jgi:hypothetical protein